MAPLSVLLLRCALVVLGSALAAPTLTGCGSDPPPEPEVPKTVATAEPEPEPEAKKPDCKALDEKCTADASTQARLAKTDLVFIPPEGWIYAQEAGLTITQTEEGGGALAVTAFESKDPKAKETKEKRDAAVAELAQAVGIALPEKNRKKVAPNWDRPDGDVKVGEMTLQMWQFEGATRGTKQGPVLFFAARSGETQLIGLGFAPKDDTADAQIMKALETIGPAPVDEDAKGDGDEAAASDEGESKK